MWPVMNSIPLIALVEITSFRLEKIFQPIRGLKFIIGHMTHMVYILAYTFYVTGDSHLEHIKCFFLFEANATDCVHVLPVNTFYFIICHPPYFFSSLTAFG